MTKPDRLPSSPPRTSCRWYDCIKVASRVMSIGLSVGPMRKQIVEIETPRACTARIEIPARQGTRFFLTGWLPQHFTQTAWRRRAAPAAPKIRLLEIPWRRLRSLDLLSLSRSYFTSRSPRSETSKAAIAPDHEPLRLIPDYLQLLDASALPTSSSLIGHVTGTIVDLVGW